MPTQTENVQWLVSCPASDENFRQHLQRASTEEIRTAIELVKAQRYQKTKLQRLESALRRKEKEKQP